MSHHEDEARHSVQIIHAKALETVYAVQVRATGGREGKPPPPPHPEAATLHYQRQALPHILGLLSAVRAVAAVVGPAARPEVARYTVLLLRCLLRAVYTGPRSFAPPPATTPPSSLDELDKAIETACVMLQVVQSFVSAAQGESE